jgi:hypothetical protein
MNRTKGFLRVRSSMKVRTFMMDPCSTGVILTNTLNSPEPTTDGKPSMGNRECSHTNSEWDIEHNKCRPNVKLDCVGRSGLNGFLFPRKACPINEKDYMLVSTTPSKLLHYLSPEIIEKSQLTSQEREQ